MLFDPLDLTDPLAFFIFREMVLDEEEPEEDEYFDDDYYDI